MQLAVVVALTWRAMGPSVLAGAVIILLGVPLQVQNKAVLIPYQKNCNCDSLAIFGIFSVIRIMHEIINGVKVIKMYGWEHAFAQHNAEARKRHVIDL